MKKKKIDELNPKELEKLLEKEGYEIDGEVIISGYKCPICGNELYVVPCDYTSTLICFECKLSLKLK
jgi:hypothetical protein